MDAQVLRDSMEHLIILWIPAVIILSTVVKGWIENHITLTIGIMETYKETNNKMQNMEYLLEAFKWIKENVYDNEGYLYLQRFVNANR